ncbi:MAG: SIR2 family protein [Acidobacteriia bacterium]|nr:SIR2 family protein [Terriglobia bacterium]
MEEQLEQAQSEAGKHPARHQQLAAIRFYIRTIIWEVETAWTNRHLGVTNYKTLLDDLERWRSENNEEICLVTFNYDKMLESALSVLGVTCNSLEDYVAPRNYKLIKIHGSVDWVHPSNAIRDPQTAMTDDAMIQHMINNAGMGTTLSNDFDVISSAEMAVQAVSPVRVVGLFPAIAIPVITKTAFECPESHLKALREAIPKVNRILTIGWRGTEKHFLKLLKDNLTQMPKQVIVVAGSRSDADRVESNLKAEGIGGIFNNCQGGFSQGLTRREIDHFLWAGGPN